MMDAIISGIDGVAIYEDEQARFFLLRMDEEPSEISCMTYAMWMRHFRQCQSFLRHENLASAIKVKQILAEEWTHDRIVRMAIISIDPAEDAGLRIEAQAILDGMLVDSKIKEWFIHHDPRPKEN